MLNGKQRIKLAEIVIEELVGWTVTKE